MLWTRLLGLAFFVLIWAGQVAGSGSHPAPTVPAQTIANFYLRYRAEQLVGVYLQAIAGLVLVVLAAYLSARLRDGQATAVLIAPSAALTTAAFSFYLALNGALAFGISSGGGGGGVAAVMLLSGADFARSGFFAVNGDLSFMGFFVLIPLWAATSGLVLLGQRPTDSHASERRT